LVHASPRQRVGERTQPVAGKPCLLEPFPSSEIVHPCLERLEEPARKRKGGGEAPDELSVAFEARSAVAGGHAAAHLAEGTGREPGGSPHPLRASADGERLLQRLLGKPGLLGRAEWSEERAFPSWL